MQAAHHALEITPAMDQLAECREQGKVLTDRLEDHVKRCQQYDNPNAVNHVVRDADTE